MRSEILKRILDETPKEVHEQVRVYSDAFVKAYNLGFNTALAGCNKHDVSGKLAYYQLCPKCFGEGQVFNTGATSSLYRTCPVCNGAKTLRVETCLPACASGAVDTATCGVDDNGWHCLLFEQGKLDSPCKAGCVHARSSCEG